MSQIRSLMPDDCQEPGAGFRNKLRATNSDHRTVVDIDEISSQLSRELLEVPECWGFLAAGCI